MCFYFQRLDTSLIHQIEVEAVYIGVGYLTPFIVDQTLPSKVVHRKYGVSYRHFD